jgi:hypothetical protein
LEFFVSGCFRVIAATEVGSAIPRVQSVNSSAIVLKEKDFILTSDEWRGVVELNMSMYEDVISVIRQHLMMVLKERQEFTPISELRQIESLLNALEARLIFISCYLD